VEIKTTMTFGVAEYNHNESIDDNVSKADRAMYFGKDNGRNQVINYWNLK
jgi:PleD family two-component response regulator